MALHRGCNHCSRCQLRVCLWRSPALQVVLLLCYDLTRGGWQAMQHDGTLCSPAGPYAPAMLGGNPPAP